MITAEALGTDALVVHGSGPRVRIYCVYGDDALEGDVIDESSLSFVAADGDWRMLVPCLSEDLAWVERALELRSSRVRARACGTEVNNEKASDGENRATTKEARIDRDALRRG
jgi:hypothetical protein